MSISAISQLLSVIVLFVLILALTYYVTKWIASYQKASNTGGNIEIMETCRLSPSKYIQIIKVSSKYLVISVSKDSVTLLTELSEDEYEPPASFKQELPDFNKELTKVLERIKKK